MKTTFLTVFAILSSISTARAEAIQGVEYLKQWSGFYKVTECTQCTDYQVESGENLKNLADIGFGAFAIAPADQLECRQTDYTLGFSYTIKKDNAAPNDGMNVSYSSGQCDWAEAGPYTESLKLTDSAFVYERHAARGVIRLTLQKLENGAYQIERHETDATPSWGLPQDWSFQVKAVRENTDR